MAQQPEIQYVRYYSYGSAAQKIEPKASPRKTAPKQQQRPVQHRKIVIRVDPLAVCGTVVALVMLLMMMAGVAKLQDANREALQMQQYLTALQEENVRLDDSYHAGYDLEEIEKQALALGMVPKDQVQQIPIQVQVPNQAPQEQSWWENVYSFLVGLFA